MFNFNNKKIKEISVDNDIQDIIKVIYNVKPEGEICDLIDILDKYSMFPKFLNYIESIIETDTFENITKIVDNKKIKSCFIKKLTDRAIIEYINNHCNYKFLLYFC